jgi:mRNA interferase MazF
VGSPSVGAIVLLPFPFSDLSRSKVRPAVVLADVGRDDWVLCQITSKAYADSTAIKIEANDFEDGSLKLVSYVRPGKLFTANTNLMVSCVGKLKLNSFKQIIDAVIDLLDQSLPSTEGFTESEAVMQSQIYNDEV